ncbi:hypothetical protein ACGK9U_09935 [Mariniflexile sp. HNIBRBA6329]|uniref:hypothetical protein n=1 Tax=Mariniflexile sp. HNIBRBA6329 TaxID=3373088 RepID=UPI0037465206
MKKTIKIISLLFIILCLNSCFIGKSIQSSKARSEFTEENDAIPPNFGKFEHTVIVGILKGRRSYDKYLKSAFKKNYNGAYVLLTREELKKPEYRNMSKYRYVFDYTLGTTRSTIYSDGLSSSVTLKRYYVEDRIEDKIYQSGAEFSYFAKAMKIYVANLEKKRLLK